MMVSPVATVCATLSDNSWGQTYVSAPTVTDSTMMAEIKMISLLNILIGIELCTYGESDDVFQFYILSLDQRTDIEVARADFIEQRNTAMSSAFVLRYLQRDALTECDIQAELG